MNKLLLASLLVVVASGAQAATLRCDNGIADRGDRTSEVLRKCGSPVSQSVTGYVLDNNGNHKFVKEEWVYGPRSGMIYFLQFEGERLVRVNSKRSD